MIIFPSVRLLETRKLHDAYDNDWARIGILCSARSRLVTAQTAAIDSQAVTFYCIDPKTPEGLQELFQYSSTPQPIVSGHRGRFTRVS